MIFLAFGALSFLRWLVRVRTLTAPTAALVLAAIVAALRLAAGGTLIVALIAGAIAAAAGWLLSWLDDRYHSLATIPIWLVSSAIVFGVLILVMS